MCQRLAQGPRSAREGVNEQCQQYRECHLFTPFITRNKAVFGIEYQGRLSTICSKAKAVKIDALKKRLDLKAWRQACR